MCIFKMECILVFLFLCLSGALALPEIRFTAESPWTDGKIREDVWKKADILSGFAIPGKFTVETSRTECSMLFDDRNVYLRLKGRFTPAFQTADKKENSLFSGNHFEIFLMPQEHSGEYIHCAISRDGRMYLAKNAANKTEKLDSALVQGHVKKDWNQWEALVAIPFSVLNMKAPVEDLKFKFNLCRVNSDLPAGKSESSSFAVLDAENFHKTSQWTEVRFTRKAGEPKIVYASGGNTGMNLIPNSDFNISDGQQVPGWYVSKNGVTRKEVSEFSNQWVMRGTGKAYQMLSVQVPSLQEGKMYTLRIKVRQFGSPNAIGVIQMRGRPDGRGVTEGASPVWRMPVTDDFREYAIPFKADKNVQALSFYRFGPDREDSGIDYDSIQLFEGKLSAFEIRQLTRLDRKAAVPGTEMKPGPNPYGFAKEKLRVLALCPDLAAVREPMEIFSGLNTEWDSLITTTENSDLYYTDGNPADIQKKLESSSYDIYLIGFNLDRIGKELASRIQGNVEKGAGLVLANAVRRGNFEAFLKKYPLSGNPADSAASQGFPSSFFLFGQSGKGMGATPGFQEGCKAGKGRIVLYTASYPTAFLFNEKAGADSMFPYADYAKAWLARLICHAAGKESLLRSPRTSSSEIAFSDLKTPDGAVAAWTLLNSAGERVSSGQERVENGRFAVKTNPVMSGFHLLVLHLKDKDGKVLDYTALTLRKDGPFIAKLEDAKQFNSIEQPGNFRCEVNGFSAGMKLEWTLEDISGRILEKGTIPCSSGIMNFSVPLHSVYTNLARLKTALIQGDRTLDLKRIPVYVQDRDRERLLNDFTPAVWPFDTNLSAEYETDVCRQLENIGIRAVGFCNRDRTHILASGMGLAAGAAIGGGEIFCGWKQNSNIRKQQFNTLESRKKIARRAEENTAKVKLFGPVSNQVCDEPQLARTFEPDELDSHPENIAEYRLRMKQKYGTIEKFNARCGTSWKSFDELQPGLLAEARKTGHFAEFIEWRNFNTDRWCEILKLLADNAKKHDPNALFALPNSFGQTSLNGNDYWKLLTRSGLNFSQDYTSMVYMGGRENPSPIYDFDEFYRSFAPDMRVWGYIGYVNSPARLMFQPIWFAAHRYGGFTWFAAHGGQVRGGSLKTPWNLLDIPGNGFTLDAGDLKKGLDSMHLLTGLGKLCLDYPWAPRDTAVYYSQESMLTSFCLGKETRNGEISREGGPHHDYYYSRHRIRYMLESMLYQYDFIAPEQVTGGHLKNFKALFMPSIFSLSDAEVGALKKFLAGGGIIVADSQPGAYDELGMKRNRSPLEGLAGLHVLGSIFNDKDPEQGRKIAGLLAGSGAKPVLASSVSGALPGREAIHFRKGGMNVFILLRNPVLATSGKMSQTVQFPVKGHLYNLLNGKYLGQTSQAEVVLDDTAPAAVFGVYPCRIDAILADIPDSVRAGQDLIARIQMKVEGGRPGAHVFHIELIPPDGKSTLLMKRNLSAENGTLEFRFRMAYNDPKGKWTLRVKDVMSGLTAGKTFILEGGK
ncbi:MAG: hypothetical protein BWY31_01745 [Lentisphaerae bacterium ADurb.Bin242]|nr:MAG: hypothetical protein BWY31_01745 [Lentisphaerae bacterium ADurb.Bin242]